MYGLLQLVLGLGAVIMAGSAIWALRRRWVDTRHRLGAGQVPTDLQRH